MSADFILACLESVNNPTHQMPCQTTYVFIKWLGDPNNEYETFCITWDEYA